MPEDSVNLWTWMTVSYIEPIFAVATTRTVNEPDVWSLSPFFTHKNLFTKYLKYCQRYVLRHSLTSLDVTNTPKTPYALLITFLARLEFARSDVGRIFGDMERCRRYVWRACFLPTSLQNVSFRIRATVCSATHPCRLSRLGARSPDTSLPIHYLILPRQSLFRSDGHVPDLVHSPLL